MRACVLLFSGGLDSALCALELAGQGVAVHGLSIDFDGRPRREVRACRALAKRLPFATFHEVRLRGLALGPPADAPRRRASLEGVIPHRNLVYWALAANRARAVGADGIAGGHTPEDARAYSDASRAFFRALSRMLRDSGIRELDGLRVRLPIHERPAAHWRALVRRHPDVVAGTWSCWRDRGAPCGACFACRQRKQALRAAARSPARSPARAPSRPSGRRAAPSPR